jgi:hypothetical protein
MNAFFSLRRYVAVEHFQDGSLLLNTQNRQLLDLDLYQSWIFNQLNGQRSLAQIVVDFSANFDLGIEKSEQAIVDLCNILLNNDFLIPLHGSLIGDNVDKKKYAQNQSVNLSEENGDGAILYNPDTDCVQLLNITGLFIWKFCAAVCTFDEIVSAIKTDFDDVPEQSIVNDVDEYLGQMTNGGFIIIQESS